MRQRLGEKKIRRYARETGLQVISGVTRGGTYHRVDLFLEGGAVMYYWPKTGEMREAENLTWRAEKG